MSPARWKLVSLWLSQTARVTADNALRLFVCLEYVQLGAAQKNSAWYLVTALFIFPAVVLAPFNGALCNSLPKPAVLKATALYGLFITGFFFFVYDYWLLCWGLIAVGSAIYGPVRYALLPAAADDTHWPLTRINGFFEMGVAAAIILGMMLIPACEIEFGIMYDPRVVVAIIVLLNGIALAAAWPVGFLSDVRREEGPMQAVRDFFTDFGAVWRDREARRCLLGLSGLRGLIIGMTGVYLVRVIEDPKFIAESIFIAVWVAAGTAAGSLLAGTQRHPRRVLGFVPWGGLGLSIGLIWAALRDRPGELPSSELCAVFGVMAGLINVPLAAVYQIELPADARGNGMAIRNLTDYLFTVLTAGGLFLLTRFADATSAGQLWLIAGLSATATLAAFWIYRRQLVEQILEVVVAIMYRFRAAGPGLDTFPLHGPVVVVANHSSYMDPVWLGKVLPRTIVPMMTSFFFDQRMFRWAMVYLADAIRVEASGFRRDVPELQKAVDTLDAGKCLVIFPEGRLRRSDEHPLKLFGQGVCRILEERPETPVVVCWIEGGWGSFFSYYNGPPTKNKKFDIRRPIRIAIGAPHRIDPAILADHRKARHYLMEQCGQMRTYLGLEAVGVQLAEVAETSEPEA